MGAWLEGSYVGRDEFSRGYSDISPYGDRGIRIVPP
jgi:hypothetical protein